MAIDYNDWWNTEYDDYDDDWGAGLGDSYKPTNEEWMEDYDSTPEMEVGDQGGMFTLPDDYWNSGSDFFSDPNSGIYDMDEDTIQEYIDSEENFNTTKEIESWMNKYEEENNDGIMSGISEFVKDNKELLYLLGSLGSAGFDAYAKSKYPISSNGGGGGGSTSASTPATSPGVLRRVA